MENTHISGRLQLLHPAGAVVSVEAAPLRPSSPEDGGEVAAAPSPGTLSRDGDKVLYFPSGGEPVSVRLLWARPLSKRGGPVSVMMAEKKKEVFYLRSLDELDPASRLVAEEELRGYMILPRITAIRRIDPKFGNYYWRVETDRGGKRFLVTSPETNCIRAGEDSLIVRDAAGSCYEIAPLSGLDLASRAELDQII